MDIDLPSGDTQRAIMTPTPSSSSLSRNDSLDVQNDLLQTQTLTQPQLSKNAQKKLAKQQRLAATRIERKAREKAAKKEKRERRKSERCEAEGGGEAEDAETRQRKRVKVLHDAKGKGKLMSVQPGRRGTFKCQLVIDLGFDDKMTDRVSTDPRPSYSAAITSNLTQNQPRSPATPGNNIHVDPTITLLLLTPLPPIVEHDPVTPHIPERKTPVEDEEREQGTVREMERRDELGRVGKGSRVGRVVGSRWRHVEHRSGGRGRGRGCGCGGRSKNEW